jgi:hypothetical protein
MSRLFGTPHQNGYVVRNLRDSISHWTSRIGVGPFFVVEHAEIFDYKVRGEPASIDMSVALAASGSLQIELIEQHNDARTPFSEFLLASGEGVQHLGYSTTTFDEDLDRAAEWGLDVLQSGTTVGGRFVFYDTTGSGGSIVEVTEMTPGKRAVFDAIANASRGWDGRSPVRSIADIR